MQVRVFESEDMDSALRQIKETLGPDALILSSRTVRKGGMGLFGKPVLEVTAAIDPASATAHAGADVTAAVDPQGSPAVGVEDDLSYQDIWEHAESAAPQKQPASTSTRSQGTRSQGPRSQGYNATGEQASTPRRGARFDRILQQGQQQLEHDASRVRSYDDQSLSALHSEVGELRTMLSNLVREIPDQIEKAAHKPPPVIFPAATAAGVSGQSVPNQPLLDGLTKLGIEADAAQTIAHYAANQLNAKQLGDPAVLNAFFGKTIAELVQTTGEILPAPGEQTRLALIGPTGVGKTTTIAKLAAAYLLSGGKRVAMVTIDTYRIAAVEQLKVYGEIMNLPVEVVISPEQLSEVLQRHANKDLILIDTAGRSPKDDVSLHELQNFLAVDDSIEAHLVLSATTRERDLYETSSRFGVLEPKSLLMTKLDECESLGVLLNIHLRNNCPLSYLANGQKVPEDLIQASAEQVSALILEHSEG